MQNGEITPSSAVCRTRDSTSTESEDTHLRASRSTNMAELMLKSGSVKNHKAQLRTNFQSLVNNNNNRMPANRHHSKHKNKQRRNEQQQRNQHGGRRVQSSIRQLTQQKEQVGWPTNSSLHRGQRHESSDHYNQQQHTQPLIKKKNPEVMPEKNAESGSSDETSQLKSQNRLANYHPEIRSAQDLRNSLNSLVLKYQQFVKQSDVTPWEVVFFLPSILSYKCLSSCMAQWRQRAHGKSLQEENKEKNDDIQNSLEESFASVLKNVQIIKSEVECNHDARASNASDTLSAGDKELKRCLMLKLVQIQVWLRMMFWEYLGEEGLQFLHRLIPSNDSKIDNMKKSLGGKIGKKHPKSKRQKKKEERTPLSPKHVMDQDIIVLLRMAPYLLPLSLDFSSWMKETLTFQFRLAVPDYCQEILDEFEVDFEEPLRTTMNNKDPFKNSRQLGDASSLPLFQSLNSDRDDHEICLHKDSPPKSKNTPVMPVVDKRHLHQHAYFTLLKANVTKEMESKSVQSETTSAARSLFASTSSKGSSSTDKDTKGKNEIYSILQTPRSLVFHPKTKNRFLQSGVKGEYVGGHLRDSLSNINALFPTVNIPNAFSSETKKQKSCNKDSTTDPLPTTAPVKSTQNFFQNDVTTTKDSCEAVRKKYSSPSRKRSRPSSTISPNWAMDRLSHFDKSIESPKRQIIGETPQKRKSRSRAASSAIGNSPPRLRRQNFSSLNPWPATSVITSPPIKDYKSPCFDSSPMPHQNMSNLVAQAAKAARNRR